jgi:hypothetical protein
MEILGMWQQAGGSNGGGDSGGDPGGGGQEMVWHEPWDEWVIEPGYYEPVPHDAVYEWVEVPIIGDVCYDGTPLPPMNSFSSPEEFGEFVWEHGGGYWSPAVVGLTLEYKALSSPYKDYVWVPEAGHWVHHEGYWEDPASPNAGKIWREPRNEWVSHYSVQHPVEHTLVYVLVPGGGHWEYHEGYWEDPANPNAGKTWHEPYNEWATGHFEIVQRPAGYTLIYVWKYEDGTPVSDDPGKPGQHGGYKPIVEIVGYREIAPPYNDLVYIPDEGHWIHHEGYWE